MREENYLPPKGMRDIEPLFAEVRNNSIEKIVDTYKSYGFSLIETPALEKLENLIGQKGGENEKLIFKILKRGLELNGCPVPFQENSLVDLGLRYDLTVPLSRYYANFRERLPKPFKVFQIGNVWRAERPQKARYRQFTQCDIDIIGDLTSNCEVELIYVTCKALDNLGMKKYEVRINDRQILKAMGDFCEIDGDQYRNFLIALDKLDKKAMDDIVSELEEKGFEANLLRTIREVLKKVVSANGDLDFVVNLLKKDKNWNVSIELKKIMKSTRSLLEIPIRFDPTLVRGMDYYTGPIYEINKIEQRVSIAGGGRYDKMVGKIIGQDIPACGFSLGFERIVDDLMQSTLMLSGDQGLKVAIIYSTEKDSYSDALKYSEDIRKNYKVVSVLPRQNNLSNQLTKLKTVGLTHFGIFDKENTKINPITQ